MRGGEKKRRKIRKKEKNERRKRKKERRKMKGGEKKRRGKKRKGGGDKVPTQESNPRPSALQSMSLPLSHHLRVELYMYQNNSAYTRT